MSTWIPAGKWKTKGPQSVSAKIRARKSKKIKVARKGERPETVAQKR